MNFPDQLKYTKEHEWVLVNSRQLTVGITDHAQSALGEVVYVDLPKVGRVLKKGETFGVVESIKAVSDLYAPIAGTVVEINAELVNHPGLVNTDPYSNAWMIKIEASDLSQVSDLLDSKTYTDFVKNTH